MLSSEIAALTIGLTIAFATTCLFLYAGLVKDRKMFTNQRLFFIKKWLYIFSIFAVNAAGCCLVYYTQDVQVILYIILVLKSKDILMSVMFMFNMIYKALFVKTEEPTLETSGEINRIVAFVPAYKETLEQLCKTVDSLIENNIGQNYSMICIVSDGINDYKDILDSLIVTRYAKYYKSWLGEDISTNIYYGTRKEKHVVIIQKEENQGKKDSIILCNELFNHGRSNSPVMNHQYRDEILSDINNTFGVSIFDYLFCTDADTVVSKNTLVCLIDNIEKRNAVASCGIVNVDFSTGNSFWNNLQNFQYLYGQYIRRTNEDLFNQVLCLPGCISMFKMKINSLAALDVYSKIPDHNHLVTSSVQYVGTDRRYTSSLVYTDQNAKIVLDTRCNAYTVTPSNLDSYISQRRRWCQNTYFNSMINIIGPNVNFISRFFNVVDYLRLSLVYFRLFNTLYFVYLLHKQHNILELLPYIVILCYPVVCFLVYSLFNEHLRSQWFRLFISLIVNKIFVMFSTISVFTNMLWNIGSSSWNQKTTITNTQEQQI
jgi:cellulose synthase/poly-beta-1,6-N-acetylglucosamine synthase-like glycosyltransferase